MAGRNKSSTKVSSAVRHEREVSSREEIYLAEAEPLWLRHAPKRDSTIIVPEATDVVLRTHIFLKFVNVTYVDGHRTRSTPAGEEQTPTNRLMTVRIDEGMKVEYFGSVKDTKTRCFIANVLVKGRLRQFTRMRDGRISLRAYTALSS